MNLLLLILPWPCPRPFFLALTLGLAALLRGVLPRQSGPYCARADSDRDLNLPAVFGREDVPVPELGIYSLVLVWVAGLDLGRNS